MDASPQRVSVDEVTGPEPCHTTSESWADSLLYNCSCISTMCLSIGLEHPIYKITCPKRQQRHQQARSNSVDNPSKATPR